MKASAGSGKTYTLAQTYLSLLKKRFDYRHILAVTFTNKATAEMKERILSNLAARAESDPQAFQMLKDILHDYGAFNVSTIDKFFQQALKSFSREIGQFGSYQIELDKASLIEEAMDRILDSMSDPDSEVVRWLRNSARIKIDEGAKLNMEKDLYVIGKELKNEEYRELKERYGIDERKEFSPERLSAVRKECRECIDAFHKKAESFGLEVRKGVKLKEPVKTVMKKDPALAAFFETEYPAYLTAWIINSQLYSLGLAGEFFKAFDELLKEKNVMCLDDSNTLLRDIIAGSDAPFVYEKMGVQFENFLLDEFQDTSNIQWANFLPLLKESDAYGRFNLVVGDVKQSIYRWRDSDWRLLARTVKEEFPDAVEQVLDGNWRSTRTIVDFNNAFFRFAADRLGLSELYSDVHQEVKLASEKQSGSVRISFCEKGTQLDMVLSSINGALEAGARPSDIAILVRTNDKGSRVAEFLIENGIKVVSDDSLSVKSSPLISKLVSLLHFMDSPSDKVSGYLAETIAVEYPDSFHSLTDLCEHFLRQMQQKDPEAFRGETLYIQAFMDEIQKWVEVYGNNLRYFLKHWEDSDLKISSPARTDAVRILTIHKSKGLQFPYVIFPFADDVDLYKGDTHWCYLDAAVSPFSSTVSGIYPVTLGKDAEASLFAPAVAEEKQKQKVDNINLFYVALTRAEKVLHVISAEPTKSFKESLDKGNPKYMKLADLLFEHCNKSYDWKLGKDYDFRLMKRDSQEGAPVEWPVEYSSIALGERLKPSTDASDFFGEDGSTGIAASHRRKGILLHDILSSVQKPSDLGDAIDAAVLQGLLDQEEARESSALLSARIASHPGWFTGSGRNELSVIGGDGFLNRPDRVVTGEDGAVTVIDYKFGEERKESYIRQVRRYMKLYRQMGYGPVHGAVWYVMDDEVVPVD